MAKDPSFLFYSDNFLSGTMFLTDEQCGKYIRLLCAQHQTGHLSEKNMIFICKTYDKDIFEKFKIDDNGLYYNERLEYEIKKRKTYSESRSNNKKGKTKKEIICKSYDNHMGNGNGNGNIIKDDILNITIYAFENFWNDYDKKVGDRKKIEKKYNSISENDRLLIKEHIPKYKESQPEKQFRKNPETYLNQKSWNDEIIYLNGNSNIQPTANNGYSGYRKNTAGTNADDKKRSVDRLADCAEAILQNLVPQNVQ